MTTFIIHQTLSETTVARIVKHLEENIRPQLKADVSNYAKGRQRAWLIAEAPLSASRPWGPGIKDERLWDWIQRVCGHVDFAPDVGLVSRGGNISRHRDASYAEFRAMGINLGACDFHYEECYTDFKWQKDSPKSAPEQVFRFTGGEVFTFCDKNPHWVTNAAEDRWGINLWTVSNKEIGRFTAHMSKEN